MNPKHIKRKLRFTLATLVVGCLIVATIEIRAAWLESSLWSAASSGNALATWHLIANGADVNARDKSGFTPLFYAAGNGHPWVVHQLLNAGANPRMVDNNGYTALFWAINSGEDKSTEVMELLINAGGFWKKRPSPLFCISHGRTASAQILVLLKYGVDPNSRDSDGKTPLIFFAREGCTPAVVTLVEHRANVNLTANDGRTALSEAIRWGFVDTVKYLLDHGANVNAKINGRSMMELAIDMESEFSREGISTSHFDAVIALLQNHVLYGPQTQPGQKTPNADQSKNKTPPGKDG